MCNRGGWQYQPQRQSGVVNCQRVNGKRNPCIHAIQTTAHWFIHEPEWIFWVVHHSFQKPGPKTEYLARLNYEINENGHRPGSNANDGRQND